LRGSSSVNGGNERAAAQLYSRSSFERTGERIHHDG